jgi:pyruvate-ferredoxin/flavodoxin oxidoreductase
MENSLDSGRLAVESGYFPTFRRHPINGFTLDSKKVDFDKYEEFLNTQTRYSMLNKVNKEEAEELLKLNKEDAIDKYKYYESLQKVNN